MSKVWTIAVHTVREAVRMKLVLAFAVLIVVLALGLPLMQRQPGASITMTVQAYLSWALWPLGFVLSALAMFMGCLSISNDLYYRQIHLLVAKPISRWQYVVGKWLGVVLVLTVMLIAAGVMIYGMGRFLASGAYHTTWVSVREMYDGGFLLADADLSSLEEKKESTALICNDRLGPRSGSDSCQSAKLSELPEHLDSYVHVYDHPEDYTKLRNEILTARATSSLVMPNFVAQANAMFDQKKDQGLLSERELQTPDKIKQEIFALLQGSFRSIPPANYAEYTFDKIMIPPDERKPDRVLQLRFKAKGMGYASDEALQMGWVFGNSVNAEEYVAPLRKYVMERYHVVRFPATCVAPDGTLNVRVYNLDYLRQGHKGATIAFDAGEGLEVLYVIGTFEGNLVRTMFLIWCRLVLIAGVAVFAATFVSFPVACLLVFLFFILSSSGDFVSSALEFGVKGKGPLGPVQFVAEPLLKAVFWIIPQSKTYNGVPTFVDGRNVSLNWDMMIFGKLVMLVTTMFLMGGCLIFQKRQVAELSV